MTAILTTLKRTVLITIAGLLVLAPTSLPMGVSAADCVPAEAPEGIARPVGSDSDTYAYNSCGYFENTHYTWSPSTKVATPKEAPTYTYNQSTQKWDYEEWWYSPAQDKFFQSTRTVDQPPKGAKTSGGPVAQTPKDTSSKPTTSAVDTSTSNNHNTDSKNTTGLNNNITSDATTGDTAVTKNTVAGNALSGNAGAYANVINMLQSSNGGGQIATFTTNIDGDVQGDLVIDPGMLQPASNMSAIDNNVDINVENNGSINNNIRLNAESGNASVTDNTKAGNATSGNATAIANVVNMMNSMISANQSFMGMVNINGNFNGNILMPQSFLDQLIASNAPQTNLNISQEAINNYTGNLSNNTAITNNVTSNAESGNATASQNTQSGTAKTGTAGTNVTVFDLTNNNISAGNSMLVFVNVVGKWVGVLMDAPSGSTAAAYGGGVTSRSTANNNTNVNATNNGTINNNINVAAKTGDATVSRNTQAGYATSGDAKTAVNIANMTNSTISTTGWFGILFINVFGNWNGSFGVLPNGGTTGGRGGEPATADGSEAANTVPGPFGFVSNNAAGASTRSSASSSGSIQRPTAINSNEQGVGAAVSKVLGASSGIASAQKQQPGLIAEQQGNTGLFMLAAALLGVAGAIYLADRRMARSKVRS